MSKPLVLSLGELLWDLLPGGKRAGGAPVNFSYHAAMNGADGYAISAVGQDSLGDELVKATEQAGIGSIIQRNAWPTGTVDVVLKNGTPEYTIVEHVAWDHIILMRNLLEMVEQADAVCFGTLGLRATESRGTIIELLKHCRGDALKFFDINIRGEYYSKALIEELLQTATVFKLNDDELVLLRDMLNIRDAKNEDTCRRILTRYGLDYIILTAGASFSMIVSSNGQCSRLQAPKVKVADSVGAGDSFSGTFTAKILNGAELLEAHKAAVNTAAFVCTQHGAWPSYPDEIPDYLAQSKQ